MNDLGSLCRIYSREIDRLEREARLLLERLHAAYGAAEHLSELSASIGIAQNSAQEFDIDLLIQRSDAALYQAKQSGRSRRRVFQGCCAEVGTNAVPQELPG